MAEKKIKILRSAFHYALPIMTSYFFISITYGLLLNQAGFGWYLALIISLLVYTGAYQFIFTTMLQTGAPLVTVALTALFMNSRNSFYVLSNADIFSRMKKGQALYMVHTTTDETFAADTVIKKADLDHRYDTMRLVHILARLAWMAGAVVGGVAGSVIPFDLTGIDFCMTAMFITIFVDQWQETSQHFAQLSGLIIAIICYFLIGDQFMLAAMVIATILLLIKESRYES